MGSSGSSVRTTMSISAASLDACERSKVDEREMHKRSILEYILLWLSRTRILELDFS